MKTLTVEELCKSIIDCPHSTPIWKDSGIRVIRNFNIKKGQLDFSDGYFVDEETYSERTKRALPESDDLVISREAPMGEVCIIPKNLKCCLGQRLVLLKVNKEKCFPKYLLYMMQSKYVQEQIGIINKTGSIVSNLNIPDLKALKIPYRPIESQQKIAAVLSALDDKIALNRRMNAKLEQLAKRLYDHWFVQFDFPFDFACFDYAQQPKHTNLLVAERSRGYKSSGGKMVWNETLKREIPDGWEVKRLGEVLFNDIMATEAGEHLRNLEYCPIDEIPMHQMSFAGGKPYTEANSSLQLYEIKDILIGAMRVYFHRCCIAAKPGITRTTTIVLKPFKKNHLAYLYQVCNEDKTFDFAMKVSNGTQQPYVTWKALSEYQFAYPNNEKIIDVFCDKINSVIEKVLENEQEIQKLIALRDRLLPLLMNGQVAVCEKDREFCTAKLGKQVEVK